MRGSFASTGTVVFLTNNENTDGFRSWLEENEGDVAVVQDPIDELLATRLAPDFVVSFNYRHIIKSDAIKMLGCPIVNVHCSVLPWNRGASPNFFSYYENTPKGVTVHELTAGLDQGDILLQSIMQLDEEETFRTSYEKLIKRATEMLAENWRALRNGGLRGVPQPVGGSYHTMADLRAVQARFPFGWDERVSAWKERYGLE